MTCQEACPIDFKVPAGKDGLLYEVVPGLNKDNIISDDKKTLTQYDHDKQQIITSHCPQGFEQRNVGPFGAWHCRGKDVTFKDVGLTGSYHCPAMSATVTEEKYPN